MTEEKPYISPPPEAEGNYKYYRVGTAIPVRVKLDQSGFRIFAECPDHEKNGILMPDFHMLSVIRKDDDVTPLTKEEFIKLVRDYMSNRCRLLSKAELKNN